mgnify:FL=1
MRLTGRLCAIAAAILAATLPAEAGEGVRLGEGLESINAALATSGSLGPGQLDSLFGRTLELAFGAELSAEVDSLVMEAFHSGDWAPLDSLAEAAAPAICIRVMGESVNTGVSAGAFLAAAEPGTAAYEFFDLASDGFYVGEAPFHRLGSAELPVWMERTGSSARASADPQKAAEWLSIWRRLLPRLEGSFAEVAESTVSGLENVVATDTPCPGASI